MEFGSRFSKPVLPSDKYAKTNRNFMDMYILFDIILKHVKYIFHVFLGGKIKLKNCNELLVLIALQFIENMN